VNDLVTELNDALCVATVALDDIERRLARVQQLMEQAAAAALASEDGLEGVA
jgi:hypothetical protein